MASTATPAGRFFTGTGVWHHPGLPLVPLRWVLVRDPLGHFAPQALLSTDHLDGAQRGVGLDHGDEGPRFAPVAFRQVGDDTPAHHRAHVVGVGQELAQHCRAVPRPRRPQLRPVVAVERHPHP